MKMVEEEMLLLAAMSGGGDVSNAVINQATKQIEQEALTDAMLAKLQALARPRVMTVWFNAW